MNAIEARCTHSQLRAPCPQWAEFRYVVEAPAAAIRVLGETSRPEIWEAHVCRMMGMF